MNTIFRKNVGITDRGIRVAAAIALIILAISGLVGDLVALVLATVAVVLLATGLLGACPLYGLLGICTNDGHRSGPRPVS